MANRWQIYSRDRALGPWTAAQVREELRAGRIDPFDMVSQEGSAVKRPLVEVDEIFQNSRVQMAEIIPGVASALGSKKIASDTVVTKMPAYSRQHAVGGDQDEEAPRLSQFQALAAADSVEGNRGQNRGGQRKYLVIDSVGKIRGPVSRREIQSMWNNGVIDARSIVKKVDQPKRITIQRFIEAGQREQPSAVAFLSGVATQIPKFIYATRASSDRFISWLGIVAMLGALGFFGVTFWRARVLQQKVVSSVSPPKHRFDLRANEDLVGRMTSKKSPKTPVAEPLVNVKSDALKPSSLKKTQSTRKPTRIETDKLRQKKSAYEYRPPTRPLPIPKPRATPAPRAVGPRASNQPPRTVPLPAKPAPVRPAPKAVFEPGKTVTIGGYRFSSSAVSQCSGKCKISMTGPFGPVTAVFFKEAFGATMLKKSQSCTLTGIIRGTPDKGWQLIVSAVR